MHDKIKGCDVSTFNFSVKWDLWSGTWTANMFHIVFGSDLLGSVNGNWKTRTCEIVSVMVIYCGTNTDRTVNYNANFETSNSKCKLALISI